MGYILFIAELERITGKAIDLSNPIAEHCYYVLKYSAITTARYI